MEVVAELNSGISARPVLFSANGECIVSGDERKVRVWRLSDRTKIQSLTAGIVNCLAISQNGRWIAAGTLPNDIIIWSVQQRYKKSKLGNQYPPSVALDFSPDSESRHLLIAGFDSSLSIFDLLHHRRVLSVSFHPEEITAAKYSPQGDRFAVATGGFVRIYDRDSMELLMTIRAQVIPWYNTGLLWSNNDLFIVSERSIKRIDPAAGEVTSEWPVPVSGRYSCIQTIRQQDKEFIVYSMEGSVTIWDTSDEHIQLQHVQHPQAISSVAISPDQQYLAIGGEKGRITVRRLPRSLIGSDGIPQILPPEPGRTIPRSIPPVPNPRVPTPIPDPSRLIPSLDLIHWVRDKLVRSSWQDVLASASFRDSTLRFTVCRAICERLDEIGRVNDATDCYHRAASEPIVDVEWIVYFKLRCTDNLEHCGDTSMKAGRYDDAVSWYSAALSLSPALRQGLLVRRSQAYLAVGSWESASKDADEVIALDESSPWGYERKHAALHFGREYKAAASAFEKMSSLMSPPPSDPTIRQLHPRYTIDPAETKTAISQAIQEALSETPRVLIDTESGRLFDQAKREAWFKSLQIFDELVSSMTMQIDITRIKHEVAMRFRYVTFSHTWEGEDEPLFKTITRVVVHDLPASRTHDKLKMFCKTAQKAGFRWAWSDTCCINKKDNVVLQEALVAMFKWYGNSSLTIVFLCDVPSPSRRGDLTRSRWNTRAWTFQEYHASRVVRFYNADWTPYLTPDIPNHKESPEIISEMERATPGIVARALIALRPGLSDIRKKLCLASQRKTTHVEDAAYSLLGIFSLTLPVVYGEGDKALGRLLAHLLSSSGDTSILAWTGKSNGFNSCLPAKISVFKQFTPRHVPPAIRGAELEAMTASIRDAAQPGDLELAITLLEKLSEWSVPSFSDQRMRLPCFAFRLGPAVWKSSIAPEHVLHVFWVQTDALGVVEITTTEDLSQFDSLTLVHPWIDFLLDRRPLAIGSVPEATVGVGKPRRSSSVYTTFTTSSSSHSGLSSHRLPQLTTDVHPTSLPALVPDSPKDKETKALQLVARLRQRFGALLLTPVPQNVNAYKRVAAESEIIVQVKEGTSLRTLRDSTRILDVL